MTEIGEHEDETCLSNGWILDHFGYYLDDRDNEAGPQLAPVFGLSSTLGKTFSTSSFIYWVQEAWL